MGIGWGVRIPLWIPILVITFMQNKVKAQYEDQQANYDDNNYVQQGQDYFSVPVTKPQEVTIIQPLRTTLPVKPGNPAHNGRVCSTWGNFHFKTFDGDIFHFPGLCNYVFASHCKSAYEDFNIQIRRTMLESSPVINHITLKLDGMVIELTSDSIVVNGNPIQLPFSQSGILIERSSGYLKITAKMGLVFMWNQLDGLLVELDKKYANQTCGLCGDFNGIPIYNEFTSNNIKLTDVQFGNMQKMDGPTEQCEDPTSSSLSNCSNEFSAICQRVLTGEAFVSCNALVDVQDYIDSCVQDLCRCDESMRDFCICNTFAEYSRQCAHAGGQPLNWRTKELCNKTCPYNMQHEECGSPCANTCTNPERSALCEDHCTDGCVCPPGTVSDDINSSGCIPLSECHCTYKGETYSPGASFASQCTSCTCTGGQWSCVSLSCPGTCSIEGGSHISTFDEKRYSFFGDCSYILTKLCDSDSFTVLGEVRKCGLTDTETCLKGVAISIGGGQTIVVIKPSGSVFVNTIYTQLPISAANVTIFRPSSFFIIVQTNFGLQVQIQLVPIMQLFVNLDPSHKGQTCGLCGNFNNIQTDDFKATSGVVEGTAAAFANTWKIQGDCPNVKNIFENPCTLSIENEKYAQHWCGLLTDTQGPFAECHSTVNPDVYHTNCLFDTCNCEKSEDCMCAALSTYVRACAAKGVLLNGWRTNVCTITSCPKSLTYSYVVNSCQPTCRSLSEPDVTCNIKFTPVDGCTCANGTYMDENGKCVPATSCPCYYKGSVLPSGEVVHDNGVICSCTHGKLDCVRVKPEPVCAAPMVYFDCSNVTAGTIGSECQKSCQTLDMGCYSTQCVSGCVCPNGLVSDGKGGCVAAGECPCVHNDASYNPGETIKVNCNTCTCKNRMWQCTNEPCLATCSVYGDGHYITFDGKRFSFSGDCEYTLVQDYCGKNSTSLGTFRVITENIPCGTTGTTCSKAIKVFLGNYELVLSDGKFEVIEKVRGGEVPYKVRYMGIYMVIDTNNGLILMWDKKTSIFIKLSPDFKGQVCGLCGNYDGNGINDFTTRSQSVVGDVLEFGNSWKVSPTCPDAKSNKDPCTANPYRNSWAQKQCSIINSKVFAACHSQVEPNEYYEACVTDACACDTGGDCECFCTAVASYAQACNEAGICVAWRTPSICPLFCDYYNPQGECEWHYKPCGSPCMKTCRNRSGKCLHELQGLEGCYPKCPENKPYFDEDDMECVDSCGCYDTKGKYYKPGIPIRSEENCQSCECTMNGIKCEYDEDECHCTYDGKQYEYEDVIYDTTDGIGGCIIATCGHNGTIDRKVYACSTPLTTTPFSFSSSTPISTTTVTPTTSVCVREVCQWSQWYDVSYPGSGINDGDFDTFDNLRAKGYKVCKAPKAVECRSEKFPNTPLNELEQKVECSTTMGLICYNKDQHQMICDNFQIKILCCSFVPCEYTTPATTTPAETTTPITKTTTPETTVTSISSTTTALPTTTESKTTTLSTSTMTYKTPSTSPVTETTSVSTSTLRTTAPSTTIPETTASPSTETVYTTGEITSTTPCKPKCKWSEWHDVHFPSLDNKGDSETYDDIRAAGKVICSKPENIECRAEKFPEKSIDNIGQIVQCNVSFGLVCRNEDQEGVLQMCYNYQIKVFCCDDFSHCPSTSTTTETTTTAGTTIVSTETSTQTPTTTETTTSTVRTTPSPTTTTETTTKEVKTTTLLTTTPIETTTIITTPFTTTTTETTTTPGTPIVSTETSTLTPTTTETTSIGTTHSSITSIETTTVTTTPFTATTTQTTTTTGTTTMTTPQTTTPITSTPIPDTFTTTTTSPTTTQTTTTEFTTIISTITTPTTTETTTAATTTPISTTKPTSSITVTTTPAITTISETTTAVTTVPPTTDDCFKELCEWSQWYDISYPGSATNDGDFDTFKNIRAKGYNVCKAPKAVECRAERFPNTPLNELEQNVICSKTEGLICYNKDQLPPICYNYQIKIECCRNVIVSCSTTTQATTTTVTSTPPIPTTTPTITPIGTTTPATTTVTTIPTTTQIVTTTPSTTPIVTTTPATTTILTTSTTILTTTPTITPIGTNTPATTPIVTTTPATTTILTTSTTILTTTPTITPIVKTTPATTTTVTTTPNITPIGTTTPATTPIETTTSTTIPIEPTTTATTTTVTTTPATTTTVTTRTTATTKKIITQIKTTKTAQTAPVHEKTTQEMHSTTKETTLVSKTTPERTPVTTTSTISTTLPTTTSVETTTSETTRSATTTGTTTLPTTAIPTTSPRSTTTGTTTSSTTKCQPTCTWSKWFDVDFPSSGPKEGDIETYNNIRAAGEIICRKPANIECRAENQPDISIDQIGQVVQCDVNFGLVCKNKDQIRKFKMCLNYEVRVLCCEENPNCPTATTSIMTTTTRTPTTTVTETTTRVTTSTKPTVTQTPETTTSETTPVTTTNEPSTSTSTTGTTTLPPTGVITTSPISTASPTTTIIETTTTGTTGSTSTTGITILPTTEIPTTSPIPTTTGTTTSSTTKCQPTCTWSKWFDVDFPSSGPKEGDIETYNNIRAAGEIICGKPANIECRAENQPDISIDQIGQVVQCDVNFGLVCKNKDQIRKFKMCLNYEVRVLCCEENPNCPTATTSIMTTTTRTPTTTVTETTTRITTSTKPTVTQTPETTTSETTPVTTTNEPSTSTSTTGTTTLPPTGVITTSPISTASPTTTIIETTTTGTTGSTSTTGTTTLPTTEIPTTSPIPTTTGTTTSSTTKCQPTCTWSKWFDVDFPSSGPKEGDIETYNNIRAAGEIICGKPANIECRAENQPDISIDQIGQVVQCDVNFGLVCKNKDQIRKFKMCLNYEVRVLCCEENPNCPTATTSIMTTTTRTPTTTVTETTTRVTTSTKPTVTQTPETTTSETTPVTTTNEPSTSTSTTGTTTLPPTGVITTSPISTASPTTTIIETTTTGTTGSTSTTGTTTLPTTEIPTTSPIPTTTGTTTSSTTKCQPTCTWSKWFDVDFPSSGPKEGDIETYNNIRAAGEIICGKPANIECRAENQPDISIDQIGQVVQCDVNFGLVCKNEDQISKFKMCFNYQIRVLCCEENPNCPTATTSIMTTTTRTPTTTVTETTTRVTTSTKPTVTQTPETTTSETTPVTTTNEPSTSTSTTGTTTLPPTGVITTSPISTASPTTTIIETTTTGTTGSTSTTGTTILPTTEIPTTSPIPTTTGTTTSSTTKCQPTCTWSKWFDVDFPSSGPKEGDIETYNNIRAAGEIICGKPANIECRAENQPDISIDQIGQVVQCDVNFGLVCKNKDQIRKFKMCLNYEVRVLCCEENPNCPTATTSIMTTTTRTPTTTVTETTTRVTTSTKPTVTQTPETTTSETTPVTTTNEPSTSTSTTGTTTLPPTGVITTSPISTASPTTTIIETTTTGTTGSTSTTGTTILPTTEIPTTSPIPTTTGTTTSSTTKCQPTCTWSKWFDVDFPSSGPKEGDIETYNNIRAAGEIICGKPANIECRAENQPDISIDQIGQVVQCDVNFGLVCKNKDQIRKFKMCLNYEVRVLCCEENPNCPTATTSIMTTTTRTPTTTVTETTTRITTSTKPTVTQTPETTTSETTPVTTTNEPSTSTSTTGTTTLPPTGVITTSPISTASPTTTIIETTTTGTTGSTSTTGTTTLPTTEIPTTSPIPTTTGTTTSSTTKCQPTCTWSKWFDVDFPSSGPKEGDIETYNNIRAAGEIICGKPANIECRAENQPDISIDQIGQVVQCDVNFGLVCKNKDQIRKFKMCLNYEVRVLCCEENPNCPTATTSIITTTTRTPTTTVTETTTRITTSTKPTVTQTPETTTSETTPVTTTNEPSTSTSTTGTTTLPPTGVITTSPISTASPTTTIIETTTTGTTGSTSTTGTTTLPTTEIPTTSPIPTTTGTTTSITTKCQPTCTWSKWFDVDFPSSGPKEGDIETYNNIRAAGEIICGKPANIECRAENQPDISIDQIGQVVQCDVNFGLVCKNEDQISKFKMCFNYQIRVLCCEENPNCPTATTSIMTTTTRTPTTTVTETTTRVTTSTKPTVTQTPETTTSETTPVTTTNEPSTSTSTTGTTTLPPTGVITTSPISTASPTTTIIETTTTGTTGSTSTTGTTTLPTTEIPTTSPIPTTTGTTTSITTKCQPTCTWSKWFDVDFPSSGPKEGDIETYNNIRAAGEIICGKPANIECRAENQPDISIDQIGQVVQCDVNFGLVCKNEDQISKIKMCFNYQIRVLCCEENVNCPVTTSILPTTPTRVTTPTISSTQTGTTEVTMTTTHCFCQIEDAVYASGEMIYNEIDKDGCNFYAICSKTCSVERFKGPCKSTTPATTTTPTTSTSKPTTTPTTTVSSTTKIECPDAKPPRKMGETWKISNCTTATCEGNNKVVIQKVKCPPVKKITCANGYPPVEVFSEDGCCYHYECECVCSGWGDPHYITFDGTYYTFLDNCTYTLVKQITPKYDNFRVDIDNYFCDAEDGLSCPQSIIVYYKYTVVVLTRELYNGVMANKIIFNKTVVNPGFQKDGISIYMLGINMVVEIPEIGATITFSGLIFSVKLPFSKFGNNTEGQCGTCTNTKIDDCRLPSGKISPSCTQMAPHWKVDDDKKRYCVGTPTPGPSTPTPAPSCPPSALCKIILSEVFEECHKVIPPQDFYKGCVFDACHMTNTSMQCSGLEIYATLCATRGVCIDWRGETKGKCPYNCPVGKVYNPCGPLNPATCDSRAVQYNGIGLTEGCFCPEGKFLVNANSGGVCVSDCRICIGPDGQPKLPGDQWKSNCQDCVCDRYTVTVRCTKRPCKPLPPVSCDDPGFVPVQSLTREDPCCVQTECRCDTSKCPESVASCQLGYELIPEVLNGNCCTIFTCKLKAGCVTNGTFYKPGAVIPKGTCEKCTCSAKVQPDSQRNIVNCQPIPCDTECPLGYEYKIKSGQCCGECVQVACVLKMENNTVHVLQAGKVWHKPGDNCTFYKCEHTEDQFIPVTVRKACQSIYPEDCDPADIILSEDGCCKICPLPRKICGLHSTPTVIRHNECISSVPVELTYCEGNCDTSSIYSLEANVMQHKCKCCQEVKTSKRQVTLSCPDGSTTDYSYIHVEQCDCAGTECIPQTPPTTPAQQQEQEQQQQEQIQQQQGQS
ncbi:mucin-5AC [Emys orbicularis]|uniref:mucin-5AC n=1 Tax=Emys orbicularis TaxID=82168 RepID=UPI0031FC6D64